MITSNGMGLLYNGRSRSLGGTALGHLVMDEPGAIPVHPDNGCKYSPSCLHCPLPQCVEDLSPQKVANTQHNATAVRRSQMVEERLNQGMRKVRAIEEVALLEGVDTRAIFRSLKRARELTQP